jgi:ABC-type uncharacterized transport system auxiliary subunit
MQRYKQILLLVLGFPILLVSCLGNKDASNKIQYYTLEYNPPSLSRKEALPYVIRVERFGIAPMYNTHRIVYRDRSYKREVYTYHRWKDNPGDLVTYFLNRDMRSSGLFGGVFSSDTRFPSSYVLEGTVDEFLEWDSEDTWEAILSLSVVFRAENETHGRETILFQKDYRAHKACKERNPRGLAEAMSQSMAELSEKIMMDVYDHLRGIPPDKQHLTEDRR